MTLVAALILGGLESAQYYLRNATDHPTGWAAALALNLPRWLLLALLAPGVAAVTARFPIGRAPRARSFPVHAGAAVLFALTHLMACVVVYGFIIEGAPNQVPTRLSRLLTVYLAGDLLIYGAIAGVLTAIRLSREARERALEASRLEARVTAAKLDALRAQLEPHFLFNTLNATSVLAMKGDQEGVVRTLAALADILRATLDTTLPHEIPLARELALLEGYLRIQAVRFADRLTVTREIEAEALAVFVPSMVLQPLVENAVRHGIEARPGPGRVTIRARRAGAELRLEVWDTGPGFPTDDGGGNGNGDGSPGIGLTNTRARLEHLYGHGPCLETGSADGGAFVALTVPWRTT